MPVIVILKMEVRAFLRNSAVIAL